MNPQVATSALKMVLNAKNFKEFVNGLSMKDLVLINNSKKCNFEQVIHFYVDDVLVATEKQYGVDFHLQVLTFIIQYIDAYGFLLSKKKCQILQNQVTFLGVIIDNKGFSTVDEIRANALANIRAPRSISELMIRLAQLGYYQNYLPQFSKSKLTPFRWDHRHVSL